MKKNIRNLIDLKKVNTLLEGFNKSTGFVTAILDLDGNVLSKSGWRPMCTEFHRVNPETSKRCTISDTVLANKMGKGKKYHAYRCLNGLMDVAVPLEVNGEHVANLFSGQFFFDKPDVALFKKQAAAFGFNEKAYLDSLNKVPIVSEEKVKSALDFLLNMTEFISEMAIQKLEQVELNQELKDSESKYKAIFESTGTATLIVDEDTTILLANNECFEMFGHDPTQLFGQKWTRFVAAESVQKMLKNHQLRRKNPKLPPRKYEVKLLNSKGEKRDVVLNINMIPGTKQSIVSMLDITESKQTEFALLQKTENISRLLYASSYLNEAIDKKTVLQNIVDVAVELTGLDSGAIYQLEKNNIYISATHPVIPADFPDEFRKSALDGHAHIKKLIQTKEIVILQDTLKEELTEQETNVVNSQGFRTLIYLPLIRKEVVNGILILGTTSNVHIFTDEEIELCKTLSSMSSLTLANAMLFNENEQYVLKLEKIVEEKETAVNELTHSEEKFRNLFQNHAAVKLIIDPENGKIVEANKSAAAFYGWSEETLRSMNVSQINTLLYDEVKKEMEKTKALNKSNFYFQHRKADGSLADVNVFSSSIKIGGKEFLHNIIQDISEKKKLQDTQKILLEISQLNTKHFTLNAFLTEVHQKLKQIVRADNFYVALYNENNNTFSFPYHVDEHDELELNKAYDFSNSYTDHVFKSNQSLIVTPEYQLEVEKDGTINGYGYEFSVWLGVPFTTTDDSKPEGVMAIQDYQNLESYTETDKSIMEIIAQSIGGYIDRIKYLEELVQAKEKAEESDRLKSAFLANMSHEIRTPLNSILGFTDLLLEPDLGSEEKGGFIKIVQQSGQRLLNTVEDIVEISKIEAGIVNVSEKEIDLNERVEELVRFFKPEAEQKGLKLILEKLLPAEKKNISTDKNKFDSILSNLMKNALKYTKSGTISVGCLFKDNVVGFYVKDTGIGIPEDKAEAIFNWFEQAEGAQTRGYEGSGLGLAITKSYVEMLGGNIWMESCEGKGSTFYFTIPAKNN